MKKARKSVICMIVAVMLLISCTVPALAGDSVTYPVIGTSTTDWSTPESFDMISLLKFSIEYQLKVDAPCSFFLKIMDSDKKTLGTSTFTVTQEGINQYWAVTPSPSSLGPGRYYYSFMFTKAGVKYNFQIFLK